jgi:kinesin family protein 6/9
MRSRVESSEKVLQAKLNLVDLAGSERVGHTGSTGVILQEARAINKSLSFLEQCVVALSGKGAADRAHVPFRSSRLTHLLKDSLGGNTKTRLLACLHSDATNIAESVSTLKFAARMRRVTNVLNKEKNTTMDPAALIARLQREVRELKQELAMHDTLASRIGVSYEPYTPEEQVALRRQIARVCSGQQEELEIVNLRQVREAFRQFKNYVLEIQGQLPPGAQAAGGSFRAAALGSTSNPATARQTPEPSTRPGSASASASQQQAHAQGSAAASSSYMVGEMDESAGGGFGIGLVSAASRPAPRPDSRDEPLKPSNIVKSRQRAAAIAQAQQQARVAGGGAKSAPSGQQLQMTAPAKAVAAAGASRPAEESKTNGTTSSSSTLPALRQATFSTEAPVAFSPSRNQGAASQSFGGSGSSGSFGSTLGSGGAANATAEAAAFAAFKATGPGFDAAELCAAAKQQWSQRRRALRQASLRVNELKQRIDALSAPLAARRQQSQSSFSATAGGVEVLDESEYAALQELSATKAQYKQAYAARLDIEAAALQAEQEVRAAREDMFAQFSEWFREQYGMEPNTNIGSGSGNGNGEQQHQMSPRAAERLNRLGRSARAAALAKEEAMFMSSIADLEPEARSFLVAARNRERHARKMERPLVDGGRRPYVGAAFK